MLKCVVPIFFFFNTLCWSQGSNKCEIISAILSIEKVNNHLNLGFKSIGFIRIVDKSGEFANCKCTYKNFLLATVEQVPLDFNTGRHVDLAILKLKKDKNIINVKIFYALSGQTSATPNLFTGDIKLITMPKGVKVTEANIGNIQ